MRVQRSAETGASRWGKRLLWSGTVLALMLPASAVWVATPASAVTAPVVQFGTTARDKVDGVVADSAGNVYVAGSTSGTLTGTSLGSDDAFVRKYTSTGNVAWTRQFGTSSVDVGTGIAVDNAGNVYVVGYTDGSLAGTNAGGNDAFVRKYTSTGSVASTWQFGTAGQDTPHAVAVDSTGNVYVVGDTDADLGDTNAGGYDAFVRRYTTTGSVGWTSQFGTTGDDSPLGVAVDNAGHVDVVGSTTGSLFGTSSGQTDAFVRQYTSSTGAVAWSRQYGTSNADHGYGVAVDSSGNIDVVGQTGGILAGTTIGNIDGYVRQYTSSGDVSWTQQYSAGTYDVDFAYGVAVDSSGNVYVGGGTAGAFDGFSNQGQYDAYVRQYTSGGTLGWTHQEGTAGEDVVFAVATDSSGNVYAVGRTNGAFTNYTNLGDDDMFIMTDAAWSPTVGNTSIALTSAPESWSLLGATVTYTATVIPDVAVLLDGGTVTLTEDAADVCTDLPMSTSGVASCARTYTSLGTHTLSATYSGTGTFLTSTSDSLTHQVGYGVTVSSRSIARPGGTLRVKLQLTNAAGANLSANTITLTVTEPTWAPVTKTFTYVAKGKSPHYEYSLPIPKTQTTSFDLVFTATADPVEHHISVTVR